MRAQARYPVDTVDTRPRADSVGRSCGLLTEIGMAAKPKWGLRGQCARAAPCGEPRLLGGFRCLVATRPAGLLLLELLGHQESELERLRRVEARVAEGVIAVVEILIRQGAHTARAFGDVLAGHLDVDAARMGAFRLVHRHEAAQF